MKTSRKFKWKLFNQLRTKGFVYFCESTKTKLYDIKKNLVISRNYFFVTNLNKTNKRKQNEEILKLVYAYNLSFRQSK